MRHPAGSWFLSLGLCLLGRCLLGLCLLCVLGAVACSGREQVRPEPTPVAVEPEPTPEPEQSGADEVESDPPLDVPEESSAPEGPECRRTTDCAAGLACRGPNGCGLAWACAEPLECGATRVAYCDCDGTTFHAQAGCPGRVYDHVGPCSDFGPRLVEGMDMGIPDGDEPLTSQDRTCESVSECRPGQFCMGVPGCASDWRCARARGCAAGGRAEFCGCDAQTFTASARCPNRPYLHTGACREGDQMIARADPRRQTAAEREALSVAGGAGGRAATTPVGIGTRGARSCTSSRQCPAGQVCQGEPGCGQVEWTCGRPRQTCVRDTQVFCSCDDEDFRASMFCPGRPYAHRGSCEIDRLLDLSGARQR